MKFLILRQLYTTPLIIKINWAVALVVLIDVNRCSDFSDYFARCIIALPLMK